MELRKTLRHAIHTHFFIGAPRKPGDAAACVWWEVDSRGDVDGLLDNSRRRLDPPAVIRDAPSEARSCTIGMTDPSGTAPWRAANCSSTLGYRRGLESGSCCLATSAAAS